MMSLLLQLLGLLAALAVGYALVRLTSAGRHGRTGDASTERNAR